MTESENENDQMTMTTLTMRHVLIMHFPVFAGSARRACPPAANARLVVELRGDVQALGLGELVARAKLAFLVFVINQLKFQPVNFFPCRLHISNGLHHVLVLFTCQLGHLERRHVYFR